LQVIDEIFAGELLLGHRSIEVVLISDVAVEIDLAWDNRLTRKTDSLSSRRYRYLAVPSYSRKASSVDDECRILDRRAAVAGDQPRAFEHRYGWRPGLSG